ncbi:hypothetical protein BKA64DRAFT_774156 [Cadophora sp. MPI-SDFR-AT-0126]|nr:hypothetical protein BKA64DRAFT_774156 [Leotiomycetes sp. MPI-SDFR-AT-0126]
MRSSFFPVLFANAALAAVSISDPSDIIDPALWTADNAIIPDYNVPFLEIQPTDIEAAYTIANSTSVDHVFWSTDLNQTSVVLVTGELNLTHSTIVKEGYADNLLESSFWGFNAAINVANASTAWFEDVNVTVHNGAANIYVYGTDSVVYVNNSWLYSSGPVSHGVYASGNGTAYIKNVQQFSGGRRSSSFSGDSPAGYVYVEDSVAHTTNIGSAIFYALGDIFATNVAGHAEKGPVVFMDGKQRAYLTNCDVTAGLLGGVALFSSQDRQSGAVLSLDHTRLTATNSIPGLWFGNTIINVTLHDSEVINDGVLVVANFSQITQDFDHYAGYSEQPNLQPAEVYVSVTESELTGDLVAYNSSYISWSLASYSSWTGSAYSGFGAAYFDVFLDETSTWTLTNTTTVQVLADVDCTLSNIESQGFDVYYSSASNSYLNAQTIDLSGGGKAIPV